MAEEKIKPYRIEVSENRLTDFLKRVEALKKVFRATGKKVNVDEVETYTREFQVRHKYGKNIIPLPEGEAPETIPVNLHVFEVTGDIEGLCTSKDPELQGRWKVVGLARQQSNGVTITTVDDKVDVKSIPADIRSMTEEIRCDHCKAHRNRYTGLIVRNKDNPKKFLVIGTKCINDFMGVPMQNMVDLFNLAGQDTLFKQDEAPGEPQYKTPANYTLDRDLVISLLIAENDRFVQNLNNSFKGHTYKFDVPHQMALKDELYDTDAFYYKRPIPPEEYEDEYMKKHQSIIDSNRTRIMYYYDRDVGDYKNCDPVINYAAFITYGDVFLARLGRNAEYGLQRFAQTVKTRGLFKQLITPCKEYIKSELLNDMTFSTEQRNNWEKILRSKTIDQDAVKKLRPAVMLYLANSYLPELDLDEARATYKSGYDDYISRLGAFRDAENAKLAKIEAEMAEVLQPIKDAAAALGSADITVDRVKAHIGETIEFYADKITRSDGNRPGEATLASILGSFGKNYILKWWPNQFRPRAHFDGSKDILYPETGNNIKCLKCTINDVKAAGSSKWTTKNEIWVTVHFYESTDATPLAEAFSSVETTPIPSSFSAEPELPIGQPININIAEFVGPTEQIGKCKAAKFKDDQGHTFQLLWNNYYHPDAKALEAKTATKIEGVKVKQYYPATGLYALDMIGDYKVL